MSKKNRYTVTANLLKKPNALIEKQKEAKKPNALIEKQTKAKKAVTVTETVTDTDNDNVKKKRGVFVKPSLQEIKNYQTIKF